MKQKYKILVFCMIIVGNSAFCQQNSQFSRVLLANKQSFFKFGIMTKSQPVAILPANYYCSQLGFFCKKELKLETATKIPFRFRLGSLQYNDWLEGKKNAGILPAN